MPNFSSLAGLEVAGKFVLDGVGIDVGLFWSSLMSSDDLIPSLEFLIAVITCSFFVDCWFCLVTPDSLDLVGCSGGL